MKKREWSSGDKMAAKYSNKLNAEQIEIARIRIGSGADIYVVASHFGVGVDRLKRLIANRC